jgi:hypothetical protein
MPLTSEEECVKSSETNPCANCPLVKAVGEILDRKKKGNWGPLRKSYREKKNGVMDKEQDLCMVCGTKMDKSYFPYECLNGCKDSEIVHMKKCDGESCEFYVGYLMCDTHSEPSKLYCPQCLLRLNLST